jgi:hypothetical protein
MPAKRWHRTCSSELSTSEVSMSTIAKLMGGALIGLAMTGACAQGQGGPPIGGSQPGTCFSPTQSPELALDEPDAGCSCSDEESQCVSTRYQGRAWDVALICTQGRWRSVEDGPCFPTRPPIATATDCVVEGRRYADGATVPDPFSCNTCVCDDGQVSACTEIGCADPCPAGTGAGISCAACGPTDGCEAEETACLFSCRDDADCTDPSHFACIDGLCRNVCG